MKRLDHEDCEIIKSSLRSIIGRIKDTEGKSDDYLEDTVGSFAQGLLGDIKEQLSLILSILEN